MREKSRPTQVLDTKLRSIEDINCFANPRENAVVLATCR